MHYQARWSTTLRVVTALATTICVAVAFLVGRFQPWLIAPVLCIPLLATLYCVRGFSLQPDRLLVQRLLWHTEVPLRGLRAAQADPALLARSLRTFGNGGLFSFSGWFWNKKLGKYRAFVSNHADAVVLRFEDRTVVVSPHPADDFAREIMGMAR